MSNLQAAAYWEGFDAGEAKGYAAGLEAAAKCAEKHNWNLSIAKAIRALGKEGP